MMASFLSHVFGFFFLIIALLISVIFLIVKWNKEKLRAVFAITLIASIVSLVMLVQSGVDKTVNTVTGVKRKIGSSIHEMTNGINLTSDSINAKQVKELIKLSKQPVDSVKPVNFYSFGGELDWDRVPIIHPYSINSIDGNNTAFLADEKGINEGIYSTSQQNQLLHEIEKVNYNEDLILLKSSNSYHLVNTKTSEIKDFKSYDRFINEAIRLGWKKEKPLLTINRINTKYWMGLD